MDRPIGYWLKHLDRLIEAAAERAFAEEKLTRRHWQIMNVLRQSPQKEAWLTEAIRPFWDHGAITLDDVTSELTRRGWLTQDVTGLTEEDYYGAVRVLQRMAENLERATGQEPLIAPSSRS